MYDWKNTLSKNPKWNGSVWAHNVCEVLGGVFGFRPEFLLTAGPGLLQTEAWIFKEWFPDIQIIGFEPQIDRYKNLKDSFPGVLMNNAIAAESCMIEGFMGHLDGETDFKMSTDLENQKNYIKQEIQAVSIDDVLRDKKANGIVWLDIEGSELNAIRGAVESMIHEKIRAFSIELSFSDDRIEKTSMLIEMLCKFNYVAMGSSGPHASQLINVMLGNKSVETSYVAEIDAKKQMHQDVLFCLQPPTAQKLNNSMYESNDLYVKIILEGKHWC